MEVLLSGIGGLLIVAVAVDALTTTVAVSAGPGWMTRRISTGAWAVSRRLFGDRHRMLRRAGVAVTLASIAAWLLLAWIGWTLVFSGIPGAVVDTATGQAATLGQRAYFVGYTLLTLGNGEYRPGGLAWQLATVLAVGNGFVLVTLSITYLVPVTSAVTEMRQLAAAINALGPTPAQILIRAFDGHGLQALQEELAGVDQRLLIHQQRHLTYPVLHYFHSAEPGTSAPLQLTKLDEALTLIETCVTDDTPRPQRLLDRTRHALDGYRDVVAGYVSPAAEAPPPPSLDALRDAGIPTVDDPTYETALQGLSERRRVLAGMLAHDAWSWTDVVGREAAGAS